MGIAPVAVAAALALLLAACQAPKDETAEPRFKTPDKGAYTAQPAKAPPSPAGAQGPPPTAKVTVQEDLFNNRINYYTNVVTIQESDGQTTWRLTAQKSRDGGTPDYRLRVTAIYKSTFWHHYAHANDARLAPLEVTQGDGGTTDCGFSEVDCTYRETFDILLTDSLLRDNRARGLVITVTPRTARSLTLTVPPQYLRDLLEKMA